MKKKKKPEPTEMTDKQKAESLKSWRKLDKESHELIYKRAKLVSGLVKKHGRNNTYEFLLRHCNLHAPSVQEYMRLVEIYDKLPNQKLWLAVPKVCLAQLVKVKGAATRKKIIAAISRHSKKVAASEAGVVKLTIWREIFVKHGEMKAAEVPNNAKKRSIRKERDLAVSTLAKLINGDYPFLRNIIPVELVEIIDAEHSKQSRRKSG